MESKPVYRPDLAEGFNVMMNNMAEAEPYEIWRFEQFVNHMRTKSETVKVFIETDVSENSANVILINDINGLKYCEERRHYVFTEDGHRNHALWGAVKKDSLPEDFQSGMYFDAEMMAIPEYKKPTINDIIDRNPVDTVDLWTLFEACENELRDGTHGLTWVQEDESGRLKVERLIRSHENERGYDISRIVFDDNYIGMLYEGNGRNKDIDMLDAEGFRSMLVYIEEQWGSPVEVTSRDKSLMKYFEDKIKD